MIPNSASYLKTSRARTEIYTTFASAHHLNSQLFGPHFYSRTENICQYEEIFGEKGSCKQFKEDQETLGGIEPLSTKLLMHYNQMIIEKRF